MNKGHFPNYVAVFKANPTHFLEDIIVLLDDGQEAELVEDIMRQRTLPIDVRFKNHSPSGILKSHSAEELAFDFLVRCKRTWLERHRPLFEQLYLEAVGGDSPEHHQLAARIKVLVAYAQTGLRSEFFEKEKAHFAKFGAEEELDFYLLWIKIGQAEGHFDLRHIPQGRSHHTIARLYALREVEPLEALRSLFALDENMDEDLKSFVPPAWMKKYLLVYVRHAVCSLLQPIQGSFSRTALMRFDDLRRKFQSEWIQQLIGEVLEHPALEDVRNALTSLRDKDGFDQLPTLDILDVERARGLLPDLHVNT